MPYIGKSPTGTGVRSRYYFTASGGETSLSGASDSGATLSFTDGAYVDVSLNGVALVAGTDYNTTTANTIGGLTALAASDIVEILVYDIFTVADTVSASSGGTFSGDVTITGNLSVSGTGAGGAAGVVSASTSGTAISIDSSNRVTMPAQPAFMAAPSGAQDNMAHDDTIILGTEIFDVGSNFASNTFTAPVTGKYQLNAAIRLGSLDSASSYVFLEIRTSNRSYYNVIAVPRDHATSPAYDLTYWNLSIAVLADMDVNDTAIMKFGYSGGTQQVDTSDAGGTVFSGALIC
jgi:hypothetical protein